MILYIIIGSVSILAIAAIFFYKQKKEYTYENTYYSNGNIRHAFKKLNATDAEERVYYETGELNKLCHVSCGKRQGAFTVYYRNGKEYMKGKYSNNKYIGTIVIFDLNGNVKQKINY